MQVQTHSHAAPMAPRYVFECAQKRDGTLLRQKVHQACGSQSANFAEVARKATGLASHAAGAADVIACAGMASCTLVQEPGVLRLDTLADQSKVHKACHLHPGQRREARCVLTRDHTGKLRYMRMRMLVQVG
jgi:hypothetical protein